MMRYPITVLILTTLSCGRVQDPLASIPHIQLPEAPLPPTRDRMLDYTYRALDVCRKKGLSEAARTVLAKDIAQVATETFPHSEDQAEAFVALLCIESGYDQGAKSPVGATGMAQLMPQYLAEFARDCGLGSVAPVDVQNQAINIRLGACQFRSLLERVGGSIPLALAAYNSGASSRTSAKLAAGGTGAAETSGYLARHYILKEKLK